MRRTATFAAKIRRTTIYVVKMRQYAMMMAARPLRQAMLLPTIYLSSHTAGVLLYMCPRCGVLLMRGLTIYVSSVLLYMCPHDACEASAAGDAA
jgi:hypothetical protein